MELADRARRDEALMRLALDEARLALDHDDVPVGAVLVDGDGTVLGRGRNRREQRGDPWPTPRSRRCATPLRSGVCGVWMGRPST